MSSFLQKFAADEKAFIAATKADLAKATAWINQHEKGIDALISGGASVAEIAVPSAASVIAVGATLVETAVNQSATVVVAANTAVNDPNVATISAVITDAKAVVKSA